MVRAHQKWLWNLPAHTVGTVIRLFEATETGANTHSEGINVHDDNRSSKDSDMSVPVKRVKKRLKKDLVVKAVEAMKHVIEKDPTKELLEFF